MVLLDSLSIHRPINKDSNSLVNLLDRCDDRLTGMIQALNLLLKAMNDRADIDVIDKRNKEFSKLVSKLYAQNLSFSTGVEDRKSIQDIVLYCVRFFLGVSFYDGTFMMGFTIPRLCLLLRIDIEDFIQNGDFQKFVTQSAFFRLCAIHGLFQARQRVDMLLPGSPVTMMNAICSLIEECNEITEKRIGLQAIISMITFSDLSFHDTTFLLATLVDWTKKEEQNVAFLKQASKLSDAILKKYPSIAEFAYSKIRLINSKFRCKSILLKSLFVNADTNLFDSNEVISELSRCCKNRTLASYSSDALVAFLMQQYKVLDIEQWLELWISCVGDTLVITEDDVERISLEAYVIMPVLSIAKDRIHEVLTYVKRLMTDWGSFFRIYVFRILQSCKKPSVDLNEELEIIRRYIYCSNSVVKLAAFNAIVDMKPTKKENKFFNIDYTLDVFYDFYEANSINHQAEYRTMVMSLFEILLKRVASVKSDNEKQAVDLFLPKLIFLLIQRLYPGADYTVIYVTFQTLLIVAENFIRPGYLSTNELEQLFEISKQYLYSPFEGHRNLALSTIAAIYTHTELKEIQVRILNNVEIKSELLEKIMATHDSRLVEGGSQIIRLNAALNNFDTSTIGYVTSKLSQQIEDNKSALNLCQQSNKNYLVNQRVFECLSTNPMFPSLRCLEVMLDLFPNDVDMDEYAKMCCDVLKISNYFYRELGLVNEASVKHQVVIQEESKHRIFLQNCFWHSVKAASRLLLSVLQCLAKNAKYQALYKISVDVADNILISLRDIHHWGAVKEMNTTFSGLCKIITQSAPHSHDLSQISEKWLTRIMSDILDSGFRIERCDGKHSGLSTSLFSLISAQPHPTKLLLTSHTISRLISSAQDKSAPVQSRINVFSVLEHFCHDVPVSLKELITEIFSLAISGFQDSDASIRNASTRMVSALITKILGIHDNGSSVLSPSEFVTYYPNITDMIRKELKGDVMKVRSGAMTFLVFLSRLRSGKDEEKREEVDEMRMEVARWFNSTHWHVRQAAAKAYVRLLTNHNDHIHPDLFNLTTQNGIHGYLLMLHDLSSTFPIPENLTHPLLTLFHTHFQSSCLLLRSTFLSLFHTPPLSNHTSSLTTTILSTPIPRPCEIGYDVYVPKIIPFYYFPRDSFSLFPISSILSSLREPLLEPPIPFLTGFCENVGKCLGQRCEWSENETDTTTRRRREMISDLVYVRERYGVDVPKSSFLQLQETGTGSGKGRGSGKEELICEIGIGDLEKVLGVVHRYDLSGREIVETLLQIFKNQFKEGQTEGTEAEQLSRKSETVIGVCRVLLKVLSEDEECLENEVNRLWTMMKAYVCEDDEEAGRVQWDTWTLGTKITSFMVRVSAKINRSRELMDWMRECIRHGRILTEPSSSSSTTTTTTHVTVLNKNPRTYITGWFGSSLPPTTTIQLQ